MKYRIWSISIVLVIIMLFACGCEKGQNQKDIENNALDDISEVLNAESSTDTFSSEPSKIIVAKIGDVVSTDEFNWIMTEAKIFDQYNYYGYFNHAPDSGSVYIALFFDMENVTEQALGGIIFDYYLYKSKIYVYNNGYYLNNNCFALEDSEYTTANPRFIPDIPAHAKVKGCLAWSIPKDWTDLEFIYKDHNIIKFQVSKDDIIKSSKHI